MKDQVVAFRIGIDEYAKLTAYAEKEKISEDIIILRDVLRSLGSEIRNGRRFP